MPTVRGWAAIGAAAALLLLWIGFGERLLLAVALFLGIAIGVGILLVRRAAPRVVVRRRLHPDTVNDGGRVVVDVQLASSQRVRHVVVEDEVSKLGAARFLAEKVDPDDVMVGRYEVICRPRGLYQVGPARVTVRDPLGFAEAGDIVGMADELVVYPAVEELDGLPLVRGQDPTVNTAKPNFSHTGGEDFFTLREYRQGDDIRHVHWPSSAKRDILMVKQLEMPWQSRALVLLDQRDDAYGGDEAFEAAVSAAASVMRHLFGNGFNPTLWTYGDSVTVGGSEAFTQAMRSLAIVETAPDLDLNAMASRMRRSNVGGGLFVMITGPGDEANLAAYRMLTRDFLRTVVMSAAQKPGDAILQLQAAGAIVVNNQGAHWAPAWRAAMEGTWSTATAG